MITDGKILKEKAKPSAAKVGHNVTPSHCYFYFALKKDLFSF